MTATTFTREDYEHAARAAGIKIIRSRLDDPMHADMLVASSARNPSQSSGPWNPATDDGDAMRMLAAISYRTTAVRLMFPEFNDVWAVVDDYSTHVKARAHDYSDPCKAVREAAMHFAIKVGKSMTEGEVAHG